MKLKHKKPCRECPWRKESAVGYLGGWSAAGYTDAVQGNEVPACHLQDKGLQSSETAMCAGALATIKNACIMPHKTPGGPEAAAVVGKRDDCFRWPRDFFKYHTGNDYVPFLVRMMVR